MLLPLATSPFAVNPLLSTPWSCHSEESVAAIDGAWQNFDSFEKLIVLKIMFLV
jgi:hypothetical protein